MELLSSGCICHYKKSKGLAAGCPTLDFGKRRQEFRRSVSHLARILRARILCMDWGFGVLVCGRGCVSVCVCLAVPAVAGLLGWLGVNMEKHTHSHTHAHPPAHQISNPYTKRGPAKSWLNEKRSREIPACACPGQRLQSWATSCWLDIIALKFTLCYMYKGVLYHWS